MVELTPVGGVYAGVAVLSLPFAWLAWQKRDRVGGRSLALFFLVLSLTQGSYALGIGTADVGAKFLWYRLYLFGVTAMSLAWALVALAVSGRDRWLNRYSLGVVAAIPVVSAAVLFLPWTTSYVATVPAEASVGSLEAFEPGPFRVVLGLVGLVATLLASGVYLHLFVRTRHINRAKAVAVLTAAVGPWLNLIFLILGAFTTHDIAGLFMFLAAVMLTVTLGWFDTLDPVPAAHESVVERMGNGVVIVDPEGLIHDLNPSAKSMLGIGDAAAPTGDHIGDWFDAWTQFDTPVTTDGWEQLSVDRGGDRRYLELRVASFTDHRDEVVGRLVELRDVTERETHERALARFQTIFTTVSDPVYVLDDDGRFELVNAAFEAFTGYDADELRGQPFGMVVARGAKLPASGEAAELVVETRTGERIPVETVRKPIETRFEGLEGGSVGSVRDISERERVKTELSRTTERYETLVDASPLAIVAVDTGQYVEQWNPAAEAMFGWAKAEIDGSKLPVVPDQSRAHAEQVFEAVFDGERKTNVEMVLERADGSRFDASVSVAPVFHDSDIVGAVVVVADISEQKGRERALRRQNERLDEFAAVVSHDLRNPLSIADGYVQMAEETGDTDVLGAVSDAHDRMEEIIDDVLSLARDGADIDDPVTVSLSDVVGAAWGTTSADSVALRREGELGTVEGDPSRLRSLFENLFRNAEDHCPSGTTITVGPLEARDGFFVADDGPGMTAEQRERAFESGYTTADDGTGIGLATVATIADAHGWSVRITESVDGGTRFEFETGPFGERHETVRQSVSE